MNKKAYVLDIGCGEGPWLEEHGGPGVIGLDVSLSYLKIARQRAAPGTGFVLADAHNLPFKDKSFRMIHATGPLHHMEDYKRGIDEMNRVVNGVLELKETVSDRFMVHIARRMVKGHEEMMVKSLFKSRQLIDKVKEHFQIDKIECQTYMLLGLPLFYFGIKSGMLYKMLGLLTKLYQAMYKKLGQPRMLTTSVKIVAHNNLMSERASAEANKQA